MDKKTSVTDWFSLITEINRHGLTCAIIAVELNIPRTTIVGWKQGSQPKHEDGEAMIRLWLQLTGKSRDNIPRVSLEDFWAYHSTQVR
jgi:hypothetical protein